MPLYASSQPKAISGSPVLCLPVSELSLNEYQLSCTKFVEMKTPLRTDKLLSQLLSPLFFCQQKLLLDSISKVSCEVTHLGFEFCFSYIFSLTCHLRVFEKLAPPLSQSQMVMCHALCETQIL